MYIKKHAAGKRHKPTETKSIRSYPKRKSGLDLLMMCLSSDIPSPCGKEDQREKRQCLCLTLHRQCCRFKQVSSAILTTEWVGLSAWNASGFESRWIKCNPCYICGNYRESLWCLLICIIYWGKHHSCNNKNNLVGAYICAISHKHKCVLYACVKWERVFCISQLPLRYPWRVGTQPWRVGPQPGSAIINSDPGT